MQMIGLVPVLVCLASVSSTEITRSAVCRLCMPLTREYVFCIAQSSEAWTRPTATLAPYTIVRASEILAVQVKASKNVSMLKSYKDKKASVWSTGCGSDVCPIDAGYLHLREVNACHHFSKSEYTFHGGVSRCSKIGGHLSKFDNEQERMAIVNVIKSSKGYGRRWYSGAYKDGPGNTFVWRDGTSVSTRSFWGPGEPGGQGKCAFMCLGDLCQFNDHYCNNVKRAILCEIDLH